jgi:hypothetical protein
MVISDMDAAPLLGPARGEAGMSDPKHSADSPARGDDWRDERRWRRDERREARGSVAAWGGGVVLIVVGLVFLLQNLGMKLPENWWAFFLLIPAGGAFASAASAFRRNGGRIDFAVASAVLGGLIFIAIGAVLFLGVDWGFFWPVILIAVGVAVLARGYVRG